MVMRNVVSLRAPTAAAAIMDLARRSFGAALVGLMATLIPPAIDVHQPNGDVARDQPMWTYWNLQEGEISVDPKLFSLEDGSMPPVVHLDTDDWAALGASGGLAPDLVRLARTLPQQDISVTLVEMPWRVAGKKLAPAPAVIDECYVAVLDSMRTRSSGCGPCTPKCVTPLPNESRVS